MNALARVASFFLLAGCGAEFGGGGYQADDVTDTSGGGSSTVDVGVTVGTGGAGGTAPDGVAMATAGVGGDPSATAVVSSSSSVASTAASSGSGGSAAEATAKYCTDTDSQDVSNNCDSAPGHANCSCTLASGPCGPNDNPQFPPTNCGGLTTWCCSLSLIDNKCGIYTKGGACDGTCGVYKGTTLDGEKAYFCMKAF